MTSVLLQLDTWVLPSSESLCLCLHPPLVTVWWCVLKVSLQLPDRKTDVFGSELDDVLFVVQKDLALRKKTPLKRALSGLRHAPQPLTHLKLKKGKVSSTPSLADKHSSVCHLGLKV